MKRLALLSLSLAVLATPALAQNAAPGAAKNPTIQSQGFNGLFFDKSGPGAPPARATGMMGFMAGNGPSGPSAGPGPYRARAEAYRAGPARVEAAPATPRTGTTRHVRRHVPKSQQNAS